METGYPKTSLQSTVSLKNQLFRVILNFMIKNLLFAGKDFPAGEKYFSAAADTGLTALITGNSNTDDTDENPHMLLWNRGSIVSARSLVIQAENLVTSIDAACLIFDGSYFSSLYKDSNSNSSQEAANDLIVSYQFISRALMERFLQKKQGRLIFLLKPSLTAAEAFKKKSDTAAYSETAGAVLSAAQSAFETYAENFACMYAESAPEKTMLIRAGSESDEDIAAFVLKKLASEDEKSGQKKNTRDPVKWISVSGKEEGALSFFKRF